MSGDAYWETDKVVAEMQDEHPGLDRETIVEMLHVMETEGLVRYEPDNGWYLADMKRALAFLARHDPKAALDATAHLARTRFGRGGGSGNSGGDDA